MPPHVPSFSPHRGFASGLLFLAIACGILYGHTLQVPFFFDDYFNITDNPYIGTFRFEDLADWPQLFQGPSATRPIPMLTLALNHAVHQFDVAGYHLVNIVIHFFTAVLVFGLTHYTLPRGQIKATWVPFGAALLWLVHPLHTQSVTYIIQRMNSLATLFYLGAMLCFIKGRLVDQAKSRPKARKMAWFSGAVLSGLLAIGSKPLAASLPLLIFLYDWLFFSPTTWGEFKKRIGWLGAALAILLGAAIIFLPGSPGQAILAGYAQQPFTLSQRLLTQPGVIVYYLSLLIYPHPVRLTLDYDFPLATSLCHPLCSGLSLMALFALMAAGYILLLRRHRLAAFTILWYLGTLAIESSVIGLALIYEHRTYLPSVFVIILLVYGLLWYIRPPRLVLVILGLLVIASGLATYQRNLQWTSEIGFWEDGMNKTPGKARPYNNLANAFLDQHQYQKALEALQTALKIQRQTIGTEHPDTADTLCNIGIAFNYLGHHALALRAFQGSLLIFLNTIGPAHEVIAKLYNNLGSAYTTLQQYDRAITAFNRALKIRLAQSGYYHRDTASIYNNLGGIFYKKKNYQKAIVYCLTALDIKKGLLGPRHPQMASTCNNLGLAYFRIQNFKKAAFYLQKAIQLCKNARQSPPYLPSTRRYLDRAQQHL